MAEQLTIKNFGPIVEAKLHLQKTTVLIGEQASGKSTVAKLTSLFRDPRFIFTDDSARHQIFKEYELWDLLSSKTRITYTSSHAVINISGSKFQCKVAVANFSKLLEHLNPLLGQEQEKEKFQRFGTEMKEILNGINNLNQTGDIEQRKKIENELLIRYTENKSSFQVAQALLKDLKSAVYIPAERSFLSITSSAIYGLLNNKVALPKLLLEFGAIFEIVKSFEDRIRIDLLGITFYQENGVDYLKLKNGKKVKLANAASGFQSIVPVIMTTKYLHQLPFKDASNGFNAYVIEEPELCLFPALQKKLIYMLVNQCTSGQHELMITTHSPYVLSSLNNLLLAGTLSSRDDKIKKKVQKIIKQKIALNRNEFACYYLSNGKVKSIFNKRSGLIGVNHLDEISEDIGSEFEQLMELV